jgi:hypothetical protein
MQEIDIFTFEEKYKGYLSPGLAGVQQNLLFATADYFVLMYCL